VTPTARAFSLPAASSASEAGKWECVESWMNGSAAMADLPTVDVARRVDRWPARATGVGWSKMRVAGSCMLRRASRALRSSTAPMESRPAAAKLPAWMLHGRCKATVPSNLSMSAAQTEEHPQRLLARTTMPRDRIRTISLLRLHCMACRSATCAARMRTCCRQRLEVAHSAPGDAAHGVAHGVGDVRRCRRAA